MSNLEDLRQAHITRRRSATIDTILDMCDTANVTLVELELGAKNYVDQYEKLQEALKDARRARGYSRRARHANTVRWNRAKAFLTSHIERKEKLRQQFGSGVEINLGDVITEGIPKPEPIYNDEVS